MRLKLTSHCDQVKRPTHRRVHPKRESERRHHDAAVAETLALREGQVPGEQEGPAQDEEDAGRARERESGEIIV